MNTGWDVHGLACREDSSFRSQASFSSPFQNEIYLFLFLVVPWHLASIWLQRDESH